MADADHNRVEKALIAALAEHRNEPLTKRQQMDLKWWQKRQARAATEELLENLPKQMYSKLCGRQVKVINQQADRYGLPIREPSIDMYQAVKAFHDFLAKHGDRLTENDELRKEKERLEIKVLERRARILDGEIQQQSSEYIKRQELRHRLAWLAARLEQLGETLGKAGGADVQGALNDFLDELALEIEQGHLSV